MVVLEGAHLLELLLHAPPSFERKLENLREFVLAHLSMREENLHQTGYRLSHRLAVASVEVRAHREMPVDNLREVVLSQLAKRFGKVVHDKPVVVGEEFVPHLRDLPAREVEVQTIDEGHVVANDVWHGSEEMPGLHHYVDRLIGVAEHRDAGVPGNSLLTPLEGSGLTEGLHRRDDLLRHLLQVRDLVKANDVPDLNHALLSA